MHPARAVLALALAIFCAGLFASPVVADEGWTITSFHSDITVASDSRLTIVEDIHVDFGALQKHGIFRTIPIEYSYDKTHDRVYQLLVNTVTDGSRAVPFAVSGQGGSEIIKIGDPGVLVSGPQRYVISYTVDGVLNSFAEHDELYWNVDGALWPVTKRSVSATVHIPSGSFQRATCFEGVTGSTESCSHENGQNVVNYGATRALGGNEQLTIVTGLQKGAVTVPAPILLTRRRSFPGEAFDINPATIGVSLLLLVIGVGFVVRLWWLHGRDRAYLGQYYLANDSTPQRSEPLFDQVAVVAEFAPPQNLRPAEVGVLLDESADKKDVTATIIDLAVRGFLTITQDGSDWILTRTSAVADGLLQYESTILQGIFAPTVVTALEAVFSGQAPQPVSQVRLSELREHFSSTLAEAESQLYSDSMAKKMFRTRPDRARMLWSFAGLFVAIAGVGLIYYIGVNFGWGLLGVPLVVVGLVMLATMRLISVRTAAGRDLLQHVLGFRLYMNTAEKYRQQFAEKAEIFTQLLPYAIVFGSVTRWAKAFAGLDTSQTAQWYIGTTPFQASLIASNLESLNNSISSAITPVSSRGSSSGFSGGSSGGGGGGGGGGSW